MNNFKYFIFVEEIFVSTGTAIRMGGTQKWP